MDSDVAETQRRAREVLKKIKEGTDRLRRTGEAVPALPAAATQLLEAAAARQPCDPERLARALTAAEGLETRLVFTFLRVTMPLGGRPAKSCRTEQTRPARPSA
jgi:hypothetical protein